MDGSYILGVVLTILGGVALAVQSGVNATLGSTTGSKPFASAFSFAMGMAVCLIYLLIDTTGLKHQLPSAAGIACESQLLRRLQRCSLLAGSSNNAVQLARACGLVVFASAWPLHVQQFCWLLVSCLEGLHMSVALTSAAGWRQARVVMLGFHAALQQCASVMV
jgi:hypothetical protein